MSVEADIPAIWECPRCGAEARATSGIEPEVKAEKPARTHWDMLLERRSEKELEDILAERLDLLRGGEIGPAHLHRPNARQEEVVRLTMTRRAPLSPRPRPGPRHPVRGVVVSGASVPAGVTSAKPGPSRGEPKPADWATRSSGGTPGQPAVG